MRTFSWRPFGLPLPKALVLKSENIFIVNQQTDKLILGAGLSTHPVVVVLLLFFLAAAAAAAEDAGEKVENPPE